MSRRFLFTLWPFTGHLLPQLSIAMALRDRGHDVAFYSGEAVRATVEAEGFSFFGFERVDEERAFAGMRAVDTGDRRSRPGRGRLLPLLRNWLVESIPGQVADLREVIEAWGPDALATDLSLWAPMLVLWEADKIPVALSSTFMGPLIPGPDAPAFGFGLPAPRRPATRAMMQGLTALTELAATPMRRRVDEIRAGYALPPLGESVNRFTGRLPLHLVGNIPALDYSRSDLPPSVHYVGNCSWYPGAPETEAWLEAIPVARPWVHVTESTLAYGDPFLLRTAITALAGEPVELIVTTGPHRDVAALRHMATAANVHITPWLSHRELVPRCACVITVGGKATVLAAMEAGVPLVLVPTTWDKPDNARRVTSTGAGVRLAAKRCSPEALRRAVRRVLYDRRYRDAAGAMATRLAAAPGPPRAAELLEQLAAAPAGTVATVGALGGSR